METSILWNQYSTNLRLFILGKVKDEEVAKDLLQEVFVRVHLHRHELRKPEYAKSWLYSIANNLMMDHFREKQDTSVLPQNSFIPEEQQGHDPANCLRPLIDKLPEPYKKTLLLTEIEGKKQAEVARQLNISLSGVKSRVQRGRKLLQQGFIECCNYTLTGTGVLSGEHKSLEECKVCD